jgi:TPP-dependent pyruvate/acetoin dehydrogenase alpha subunit
MSARSALNLSVWNRYDLRCLRSAAVTGLTEAEVMAALDDPGNPSLFGLTVGPGWAQITRDSQTWTLVSRPGFLGGSRRQEERTIMDIGKDLLLEMYRTMQRIRLFEATVRDLATANEIPGFVHVSIGEEASAAGICAALRKTDRITSTHRGHGHLIAKGGKLAQMMAEIFGKRTGYCKGKGGSMHIVDFALGILGANGIVGAGLPIATGSALAAVIAKRDDVTACFFGDGASNEGTFHESLNLAAVWKLPVVYVCENNGFGEFTPMQTVTSVKDIAVRAQAYGIPGYVVDGNDVLEVYGYASEAVARARAGEGPTLLECKTYRWEGHVVGEQAFLGTGAYRSEQEINEWKARCPLIRFQKFAAESGKITSAELKKIEDETAAELEEAVKFARESPLPDVSEVKDDVYI